MGFKIKIAGFTFTNKDVITLAEVAVLTEVNKAIAALKQTEVKDHVVAAIAALQSSDKKGIEKLEAVAEEILPILLTKTGVEATKDFAVEFVQAVYNDLKGEVEGLATKILKALKIK